MPNEPNELHDPPKEGLALGWIGGRCQWRGGQGESGFADCVERGTESLNTYVRAKVELNAWPGDSSTGTICRYPSKNNLRISASQTPGD